MSSVVKAMAQGHTNRTTAIAPAIGATVAFHVEHFAAGREGAGRTPATVRAVAPGLLTARAEI